MSVRTDKENNRAHDAPAVSNPVCGIIRPIAEWDGRSREHWQSVHDILAEVCLDAGYEAKLVSELVGSSVIHAEIVTNVYNNSLIICDVSGRNPNVMFELGMRIAFQKPVVVVVDDATDFSFDIAPLRHIIYRRDKEYGSILSFKSDLSSAIKTAMNTTGYLKQFGDIKVSELGTQTLTVEEIAEHVLDLSRAVQSIDTRLAAADHRNARDYEQMKAATASISSEAAAIVAGRYRGGMIEPEAFAQLSAQDRKMLGAHFANESASRSSTTAAESIGALRRSNYEKAAKLRSKNES
jgi:hypothetical protein